MLYAVGIWKTKVQLHIKFMGAIGSKHRSKPIAYNGFGLGEVAEPEAK